MIIPISPSLDLYWAGAETIFLAGRTEMMSSTVVRVMMNCGEGLERICLLWVIPVMVMTS